MGRGVFLEAEFTELRHFRKYCVLAKIVQGRHSLLVAST
jgi:hypothetical protein